MTTIRRRGSGERETRASFLWNLMPGMTQEESFRCVNHRSSKKHKQNKIPQRGLGVAQLEKIRLEEQQKSFPNSHSFPAINLYPPPHSTTSVSSCKHSQDPVFAIPDLHPLSLPKTAATPPALPLSWSHHESFFTNMDNFGLPFPALYDPNAHRKQNNLLSVPPSSSGVNLPMEPPSNQIYSSTKFKCPDEDMVVGIKRPRSFLDDSPSNTSRENHNHPEYGNPIFRDKGLHSTSKRRNWKSISETDFREKDNGGLGAFLTLGLTSSSPSISSSIKSSSLLAVTESDSGQECQIRCAKDNISGSTNRDSVFNSRFGSDETFNSRFGSDETFSGSAALQQLLSLPQHLYPHLLYHQAGGQFYSFLRPKTNHETSEHEGKRDPVQAERKACIDLNLKL